ncbi:hypothetical protein BDD12DRAFT_876048 [Trichophaea hybrida]|nr:hypothetical protein BDD12DRAFT_876048 [Trichophaea hybrida]
MASNPGIPRGEVTDNTSLARVDDSIYWDGVQREICNAMLAYCELKDLPESPEERDTAEVETSIITDYAKISNYWKENFPISLAMYQHISIKRPYHLCLRCIHETDHPPEHLLRDFKFTPANNKAELEFGREIGFLEDYRAGKTSTSVASVFAHKHFEFGTESNSRMIGKATGALKHIPGFRLRGLFPGGNTHVALMFGPLIIENGATRYLTSYDLKPIRTYMTNHEDLDQHGEPISKLFSISPDRKLWISEKKAKPRRILAAIKQVCGGVFTGQNVNWAEAEDVVLILFMVEAETYAKGRRPTKSRRFNRDLLHKGVSKVFDAFRSYFSKEVTTYLKMFAERLAKTVDLRWRRLSNNCQGFCNAMLRPPVGVTEIFDRVFPWIPVALEGELDHDLIDRISATREAADGGTDAILRKAALPGYMEKTLGARVLDLPIDTTCILQTHLLRARAFYSPDIFHNSPTGWLENRLAVLRRLSLFNAYVAQIQLHFQIEYLRAGNVGWDPPPTDLARAHRTDKRWGNRRVADNEVVTSDECFSCCHRLGMASYPADGDA